MSWSYSGDPASSDLDHVRFLIGDTDTSNQFLSNEEIEFLIDREGDVLAAAYYAAKAIVALLSREYDQAVGSVKYNLSQRVDHYERLAGNLKTMFESKGGVPYCGGISVTDKDTREKDTDRAKPFFYRDLHKTESLELDEEDET